jgi:diguanylate cyclase (GGDEF)-like protein
MTQDGIGKAQAAAAKTSPISQNQAPVSQNNGHEPDSVSPEVAKKMATQIALMRSALDASHNGFSIWKVNRDSKKQISGFTLEYINAAGAETSGHTVEQLVGRDMVDVIGIETYRDLRQLFLTAMADGKEHEAIVSVNSPSGWVLSFENKVIPFPGDHLVSSYRDVSSQTRERKKLLWLAEHDYLTGIPNRGHLETYFKEVMAEARLTGSLAAFIYIDIDHFKLVNDQYGHEVGDKLLVNFVKRIRNSVPDSAFVGRIAGDEFAVVLKDVHSQEDLKDYLDGMFQAMKRPFNTDTPELYVSCSAGAMLSDGSDTEDELMRLADRAMYQAKHEGRDRYILESHVVATSIDDAD